MVQADTEVTRAGKINSSTRADAKCHRRALIISAVATCHPYVTHALVSLATEGAGGGGGGGAVICSQARPVNHSAADS